MNEAEVERLRDYFSKRVSGVEVERDDLRRRLGAVEQWVYGHVDSRSSEARFSGLLEILSGDLPPCPECAEAREQERVAKSDCLRAEEQCAAKDKVIEAVRAYREEWLACNCTCHEAYKCRGLIDHACEYHETEPWRLDAILSATTGKEGE